MEKYKMIYHSNGGKKNHWNLASSIEVERKNIK